MIDDYKILHYSGNTDGAIPTSGTRQWIAASNFTVTKKERPYTTSSTSPFTGNITEYGNFLFVTINGTGHMAPQWRREEVTTLISKFIHDEAI